MKTRIISAIIALAVMIPLIYIGGIPFAIGIGILSLLAYKEVIDLKEDLPMIVKLIGIVSLLLLVYMTFDGYSLAFGLSYKSVALSIMLLLIPTLFLGNSYTTKNAFYLIGTILILGIFFNTIILIVDLNVWIFGYLLLITILTDTFAMLIGKLIGKRKMVPKISPNKTWEGAIAGTIVGTLIASIYYLHIIDNSEIFKIILITFILAVVGQIGDLVFSKIKRENGIKDFSGVMPGHGGILDRLDSIIFVVLAFIIIFKVI